MISKKYRLNRVEFTKVKKTGQNINFPQLGLTYCFTNSQPKYSVVISSKISKKAIDRNRLRRQIYNYLRIMNSELTTNVIFYPKQSMLKFTSEQVISTINKVLSEVSAKNSKRLSF